MAASTIKEFLVKLGFQSDETSLRKFQAGIEKSTAAVSKLVLSLTGMSVAVVVGVQKFASSLEGLYFQAQQLGTTSQRLKAFQLTMENIGISSNEATAAVQAFQMAYLKNPAGISALFKGQTHQDLDPHDFIKDVLVLQQRLGQMNAQGPIFGSQALRIGELFGQSNEYTKNMFQHTDAMGSYAQNIKTVGPAINQTSKDAVAMEISLRKLEVTLENLGFQILDVFENKFQVSLDSIKAWLDKNGESLAHKLVTDIKELWDWIENKLVPSLKDWYKEYKKLDDASDGWLTKLLAISVALKAVGAGPAVSGVISMAAAVGRLALALATLSPVVATIEGVAAGFTAIAAAITKIENNLKSEHQAVVPFIHNLLNAPSLGAALHGWQDPNIDKSKPGALRSWLTPSSDLAQTEIDAFSPAKAQQPSLLSRFGNWWQGVFGQHAWDSAIANMNGAVPAGAGAAGGSGSTTIINNYYSGGNTQRIDMHIDGSGDPRSVGKAVQNQIQRTTSSITRSAVVAPR